VYFNLYKVKPVMTEAEWKGHQTADTYKRYLSELVKNWLKNI
jgi:hypothetical protein